MTRTFTVKNFLKQRLGEMSAKIWTGGTQNSVKKGRIKMV